MEDQILTYDMYKAQVGLWSKPGGQIIEDATPGTAHLFHMGAAMLGEAVELEWAFFNNDDKNIIEEAGDVFFYWTGLDWLENATYHYLHYNTVDRKKIVETDKMLSCIEYSELKTFEKIKFSVAEVFDCTKKAFIYAQEPDFYRYSRFMDHIKFLLNILANELGLTLQDFYLKNFDKLSERMGTIYSNEAALVRADKQ